MRKLLGILSVLAVFLVSPERIGAQQASVAFSQPVGIQIVRERAPEDTARRNSAHEQAGPGLSAFVVGGALVGGLVAGGWMGYHLYKGMKNGGEMMISPLVPIGIVVGGGMVVGGIIGLSIYYGAHPQTPAN